MLTDVPGKLMKIIADIDAKGNSPLMRPMVLNKWFGRPVPLTAFAVWATRLNVVPMRRAYDNAAELLREGRASLANMDKHCASAPHIRGYAK